jgi:hypothetical protein
VLFTAQTRLTFDVVLTLWGHCGPRPAPAVHVHHGRRSAREATIMRDYQRAYRTRPCTGLTRRSTLFLGRDVYKMGHAPGVCKPRQNPFYISGELRRPY